MLGWLQSFRSTTALLFAATCLAASPGRAADGNSDPTFWGDGRYTGSASPDEAFAAGVAEAPDSALVWYGGHRSTGQPLQYVAQWRRLTDVAESVCDLSLAPGVLATFAAGTFDGSGRLVLGGWAWLADDTRRLLFARYLYPSCTLDTSFDGDGVRLADVGAPDGAYVSALAADGSALLFTAQVQFEGSSDLDGLVGRLLPSGAFDPGFSGDGLVPFDGRAGEDRLFDLVRAPGGRLYAAGDGTLPDGTQRDFYLLGLQANGSPIPGFGVDGLVTIDFGASSIDPSDYYADLALTPEGGLVLVGSTLTDTAPGYGSAMAKVDASGALDPSFDGDGLLVENGSGEIRAVAAQGNGRLVVVRAEPPWSSWILSRRLASGAYDPDFLGGNSIGVNFSEGGHHGSQGLVLQGGRIVLVGFLERNSPDLDLAAVARQQNSYVFADGFEIGSTWFWSSATP